VSVSKDDVTVVLPTLNEEEAIGKVIEELKQVGYHNILVVDGYSTDRTVKIAGTNGCCVIEQHSSGKCGAIETAIENVKTPYMLVMDCDWTYDPKDIDSMLAHAARYDEIIGVRANGRHNIPHVNRFGNWMITSAFNMLMGTKLTDVCSGMYLISTDLARQLELNTRGFDVEVEIAAQTTVSSRVTEVPITYRSRLGIHKLDSWKHGLRILRTVFNVARTYNPALLFSALVALAVIPALLLLGWVAFDLYFYGVWHQWYFLTGLILFILASNGLTVATLSLMLKRIEKRIKAEIGTR
jgi:glycosyltransferase involved in cell wall biosynthesis